MQNLDTSVLSSFLQLLTIALATVLYFQGAVSIGTILIMFQFSQILQAPLNRCFEIWIHRSINDVHLQRVEQFLSLQNKASVMILDEPFSNLDKKTIKRLTNYLIEQNNKT